MATMNIGKAHITFGHHYHHQFDNAHGKGTGILTRIADFASSAQEIADKCEDNKYSQAEREMFRL